MDDMIVTSQTDATTVSYDVFAARVREASGDTLSNPIPSVEEFLGVIATPSTVLIGTPEGNLPVLVPISSVVEVNSKHIPEDALIEVVPGALKQLENPADLPTCYRKVVERYSNDKVDLIYDKHSTKELGDRSFDIFGDGSVESQDEVMSYHVLTAYEKIVENQEAVISFIGEKEKNIHEINADTEEATLRAIYSLMSDVIDEQSADFPTLGTITYGEFVEMVQNESDFLVKAFVEDGTPKCLVIIGKHFGAIPWFNSDVAEGFAQDLHGQKPSFNIEPLLVVSAKDAEPGTSAFLFLSSYLDLAKIASEEDKKERWTFFYECSPRSIFYTPRILSDAMQFVGFARLGTIVEATRLKKSSELVQ